MEEEAQADNDIFRKPLRKYKEELKQKGWEGCYESKKKHKKVAQMDTKIRADHRKLTRLLTKGTNDVNKIELLKSLENMLTMRQSLQLIKSGTN